MAKEIDTSVLLELSPERRLELIALIWDSLVAEDKADNLDEAAAAEADRRVEELIRNPEAGISSEEVRKRRGWKP